ncbi:RNA polymerase sigma-54 factor [Brachyspira hampsonii]|uniref:RNA polymerase sigma-54 factor n=1 Tax=Brachyspira hampsonii TaxID=1287055 RepID=A0A1E5NE98_9SPIR|nr:RNA polymerase factor sigma-54 [Brachyspira hampsonii]OEJ14489.1 RNA polymerase sigma-54 factor [Brachyspira hampsonii]
MINNSLSANTYIKTRTAIKNDLRLNYQTRVWLDVISLPAIELKEKIEKAMEENPFLEYDFNDNYPKSSSRTSENDINSIIENTIENSKESLFSHLKSQIDITFNDKKEIELAEQICSFINEDGYLTVESGEISNILNADIKQIEKIISIIKTFDPYGVGAKNINECLSIQLKMKQKESDDKAIYDTAIKIVENYLDELSKKNYEKIALNLNIDVNTVLKALKLIQTLEPYPAREYDTSAVKYIVPELFIFKENEHWIVKTDETFIPHLKISKKYIKLLDREESKDSINFLKEKKKEAESLINASNDRKKTLLKIGEALLKFQINFFEYGKEFMKPLTLKDMSLEVSLSESTISRIANGKYLNTVWGTFSIKYFFSRAVGGGLGSRGVKEIIKRIIENSQAKLSDEKVRLILKSEGIDISRRTVAKYRKSMNIFSSRNR